MELGAVIFFPLSFLLRKWHVDSFRCWGQRPGVLVAPRPLTVHIQLSVKSIISAFRTGLDSDHFSPPSAFFLACCSPDTSHRDDCPGLRPGCLPLPLTPTNHDQESSRGHQSCSAKLRSWHCSAQRLLTASHLRAKGKVLDDLREATHNGSHPPSATHSPGCSWNTPSTHVLYFLARTLFP